MRFIILIIIPICFLFGDNLYVLESFPTGHSDHIEFYEDEFDIRVSSDGDIMILYTILRENSGRHHYVKRYSEGNDEVEIEIGQVWQHRERGNPQITSSGDHYLELQLQTFADYYSSYELMRVDFNNPDIRHRQFVGGVGTGPLWQTWRTDSIHASSFSTTYTYQGEVVSHQLLSNYRLYDGPWDDDTSYVMDPDTTIILNEPLFSTLTKLKGFDIYAYLYLAEGTGYLNFACLNTDSLISHFESVLTEVPRRYVLVSSQNEFLVIYNLDDSNSIRIWSFNPFTGQVNQNLAYSPGPENFEVVQQFIASIGENRLYIELPSKQAGTEPWVINYTGIVRKQIAYPELSLTRTDTVVTFDGYPEVLYHRLTIQDDEAHSLLAMRTPQASTIYYYGPSTTVGIQPNMGENTSSSICRIKSIYPNPANPATTISYLLSSQSYIKINIYSLTGSLVWEKKIEKQYAGEHNMVWTGLNSHEQNVSSGIYFVQISGDSWMENQKLVVLR